MPENAAQSTDCTAIRLFAENLQLVADQLSIGETSREAQPDFSLDEFWNKFTHLTKALSAETTKLCLGFTSAPLPGPEEQNYFTGRMQQMVLALVSAFYGLPKAYGTLLRKSTRLGLLEVVSSLQCLLNSIVSSGIMGVSLEELTTTGEFWACCDRVEKLPRSNAAALQVVSKQENGMVMDAYNEIKTAKDNESSQNATPEMITEDMESLSIDNRYEASWSEVDLTTVSAAMALIKTGSFVLKKMGPALKKDDLNRLEKAEGIDDLAELVRKISPSVDDLVLVLYAPMNHENVKKEVGNLHRGLRDLLQKCKDLAFCAETEQNWISFLSEAADHNRKKTLDTIQNSV